jgi:hypothetical protein
LPANMVRRAGFHGILPAWLITGVGILALVLVFVTTLRYLPYLQ